MFFPPLSTLTWDTFLVLRGTWGFYLNHLIPLRPYKSVLDTVLLEHGGLPHVLHLAVHLIFLPEQGEGIILCAVLWSQNQCCGATVNALEPKSALWSQSLCGGAKV